MADGVVSALDPVRADVEAACELLVAADPASLERSAGRLESAVTGLSAARSAGPFGAEARSLQAAVGRARRLLENLARYGERRRSVIAAAAAGYKPDGGLGELAYRATISLRG